MVVAMQSKDTGFMCKFFLKPRCPLNCDVYDIPRPLRLQGENKEGEDEPLLLIGYVTPRSISSCSLQMYSRPRGLRGRGIRKGGEARRGDGLNERNTSQRRQRGEGEMRRNTECVRERKKKAFGVWRFQTTTDEDVGVLASCD